MIRIALAVLAFLYITSPTHAQDTIPKRLDSAYIVISDTIVADLPLRITNLNPYFTVHADSVLNYDLEINKDQAKYYWYLKSAPVGVKLDKNSGSLFFKADKSFFKSGKLKYDVEYKVQLGVQNLSDPTESVEATCTIVFYNTEIISSKIKPTVGGILFAEEGDSIRFRVQCEEGSFPVEQVTMLSNMPISNYTAIKQCDDEFRWMIPYDFLRDGDTAKQRTLALAFIATDKFFNRDTAEIKIIVRPGIDYPLQYQVHEKVSDEMQNYVANLKLTFYVLTKAVKKTKTTRTSFDITGSTAAMAGTVVSTTGDTEAAKNIGKILPSVGLTLVPVKEAVSPNKVQEQNTATQVRSVAKRLEYLVSENSLVGDKDPNVLSKTKKLQDEMKQARMQLVELPLVEFDENFTREDADKFFKDPKVNKNYKLKVN